ncbi:MAG TPA: serine/threonine-protein kinase [Polyangia bacterium]|nr:serine/threonine-protein kinase [Polyangia bacterium]
MSLIGKSIGNYQIKAKLGEGGMGAVYLGEHPLIGKRVAVKVLLEELAAKEDIVQRFFNEAKAVNDIGHQNIVDIVDFGKMKSDVGGDVVYFIMEFLDGESLAARLRRTGLSFAETMHVMAQCCSALAASHKKGIVHRDLKPENIYLCPRGNDKNFIKILDFGIAKLTGDGGQSHKTRTGLVIGTPAYMSPEQCEGKGLIDHRSDVYSLGVVMYELLTGRVPFPGEGFGEILVAHLTKQPPPPSSLNPDIKPEVEALVMHAIEKDRNRRFQSMDEFAAAVADPASHLAQYNPLPGYTPQAQGGGTVMLDDAAASGIRSPTGAQRQITGQRGPMTGTGQRPTTLSGAAGEVAGGAPRSKTPIILAAAAVLAVAGVGGFLALRGKGDGKTPQGGDVTNAIKPPVDTQKPKADEKVTITVTSDPAGAKVYRADTGADEAGVTPLSFTVKKDSPSFDILVKLADYKSTPRTISTDRDLKLVVPLEKKAGEVVQAVNNPPPPDDKKVDDKKVASDDKKKKEHHSHDKVGGKEKGKEKGEGGDDMKLLQPKF